MEERKWENLSSDCLMNIFKRLDLEMLLLDVPLVCKNWYQALLDPFCWQKLVFPCAGNKSRLAYALESRGNVQGVLKFVLDRSHGIATTVVLPYFTSTVDVLHVIDKCPALRFLAVPSYTLVVDYKGILEPEPGEYYSDSFAQYMEEWSERISTQKCNYMIQIIDKIGLHCKDFIGLSVKNAEISKEVASAIVSKLATIKYLVLDMAILDKEHLVMILQGCKDLEVLYVRKCVGFDEEDEDILKLASRIKDFRCQGWSAKFRGSGDREKVELQPFPDYIIQG